MLVAAAEQAPEIIARPEAAQGLEEALIDAMVDCLTTPDRREDRAAQRRHTAIMQRFHAAIEASNEKAVYLPELCSRIGVSGRTLRLCCQEHLDMGPKRFLLLRRMHFGAKGVARTGAERYGNGHRDGVRILGRTLHLKGDYPNQRLDTAPSMKVVIRGPAGTTITESDARGIYDAAGLPPGYYEISRLPTAGAQAALSDTQCRLIISAGQIRDCGVIEIQSCRVEA